MKRGDKLFIALMVLIVCFSGIYGLKEFGKSRSFNGINVTGKASGRIPVDSARVVVNFAGFGETAEIRHNKVKDMFTSFKEAITGLNVELNNNTEIYDTEGNCYRPNQGYNVPESCSQMTINLKFNLDNIKEDVEKFTTIVESISGVLVNGWSLGIENQNSPEMMALLDKANKDAKERAEKTADALGAKLGKLIVFSEDSEGYQFYDYFNSLPDDLMVDRVAIVHHTYSVK